MDDRVSTALWLRQVVAAVCAAGLDGEALCRRAGLDPRQLQEADARLPNAVIGRIWELAVEESGNPAIALVAQRAFKPAAFDAMGYAMMSSADLRGALERAVRYAAIMSNATTARLIPVDGGQRFELITRHGERPPPAAGHEFVLLTLLSFLRWIVGAELTPLAVEFEHAAPADLGPYDDTFRCSLRFGAASYAFVFADAELALPLHTANPWLATVHDHHLAQRIEQLAAAAPVSTRARELIAQVLPDGEPTRRAIASAMGLSERTLQRRLQGEASSYQALLDATRRALAERYLASRDVSLAEAACLLGFSGQASFTRACRRWFAASPRQVRLRLASR